MNRPLRRDPFDISAGSVWAYGEERDHRSPEEKLSAALDTLLADREAFDAIVDPSKPLDEQTFAAAEQRFFDSQATFERLIEDITCISADRIRKGLMA
jgi:hypothetical protein